MQAGLQARGTINQQKIHHPVKSTDTKQFLPGLYKDYKTFQMIYFTVSIYMVCYIKNVQNIKCIQTNVSQTSLSCKLGGPTGMYCRNFSLMIMFELWFSKWQGKISNFLRSHIVQGPLVSHPAMHIDVSPQRRSTFEASKSGCPFYVHKSVPLSLGAVAPWRTYR